MCWIQTYSGKRFDLFGGLDRMVDLGDIAHALSHVCRFNGHCCRFYSVAEHSLNVAALLPGKLKLWGLLHDAAEAYVGDIVRPLKEYMRVHAKEHRVYQAPVWAVERQIHRHILQKLDVPYWSTDEQLRVMHADEIMLATECRDLMGGQRGGRWHLKARASRSIRIDSRTLWYTQPHVVRRRFISAYKLYRAAMRI